MKRFWAITTAVIIAAGGPLAATAERALWLALGALVSDGIITQNVELLIGSGIIGAVGAVFGALKNTQASKVAQVAAMPEVIQPIVVSTASGLADKVANPKVIDTNGHG